MGQYRKTTEPNYTIAKDCDPIFTKHERKNQENNNNTEWPKPMFSSSTILFSSSLLILFSLQTHNTSTSSTYKCSPKCSG